MGKDQEADEQYFSSMNSDDTWIKKEHLSRAIDDRSCRKEVVRTVRLMVDQIDSLSFLSAITIKL